MEPINCPICFHEFNTESCIPLVLYCGHSFCQKCTSTIDRRMGALYCPLCRSKDYREVSQINKNYALSKLQPDTKYYCSTHPDRDALYFCLTDDSILCCRCVTLHKMHDFYDINDPIIINQADENFKLIRKRAENELNQAQTERQESVRIFDDLKKKKDIALDEIHYYFDTIVDALNHKKQDFEKSLNGPYNKILKRIQKKIEECDDMISAKFNILRDIEQLNKKRKYWNGIKMLNETKNFNLDNTELSVVENIKNIEEDYVKLSYQTEIDINCILESIKNINPNEKESEELINWSPAPVKKIEEVISSSGQAKLIDKLSGQGFIKSSKVKSILKAVDRKDFIPSENPAYDDHPQKIGFNTTISAPHIHAISLELLEKWLIPGASVLDIGCGSGYLTICFAKMIEKGKVFGIDHIEEILNQAVENSNKSNYYLNQSPELEVKFAKRDGKSGLIEFAPYNVIHIGAATTEIPEELIRQLAPGGALLAPVGPLTGAQRITLLTKSLDSSLDIKSLTTVNYAPLTDREKQCPL
ncbi:unnamed protein product [Blepharisma stoltei]|uniref:protein-L-isoaspartate(D-aspartate) O-methyltransferase n=1 Tax=Blepharisma stoltei TaxID=1481888 RepID=A0AAU9KHQ3_9CILI|nr:unnamed protein product [Blepharisma stoltei]